MSFWTVVNLLKLNKNFYFVQNYIGRVNMVYFVGNHAFKKIFTVGGAIGGLIAGGLGGGVVGMQKVDFAAGTSVKAVLMEKRAEFKKYPLTSLEEEGLRGHVYQDYCMGSALGRFTYKVVRRCGGMPDPIQLKRLPTEPPFLEDSKGPQAVLDHILEN